MRDDTNETDMATMGDCLDGLIRSFYTMAYRVLLCVWFFLRPTSRGASVAVWHDGRILIVKNSYRKALGLPGGCIDRGEREIAAAARELKEEVGLRVDEKRLTFVGNYFSEYEFKKDTVVFFEVTLSSLPKIRIDHREIEWAAFEPPSAVLAMDLTPQVREYLNDFLTLEEKKNNETKNE